ARPPLHGLVGAEAVFAAEHVGVARDALAEVDRLGLRVEDLPGATELVGVGEHGGGGAHGAGQAVDPARRHDHVAVEDGDVPHAGAFRVCGGVGEGEADVPQGGDVRWVQRDTDGACFAVPLLHVDGRVGQVVDDDDPVDLVDDGADAVGEQVVPVADGDDGRPVGDAHWGRHTVLCAGPVSGRSGA